MNKVKYLLTYRYAEITQDLGVEFVHRYILSDLSHLSNLGKFDRRTADQIIQALRSGKQNIVEGVGFSDTSKTTEIKLLGVAKASFEEALADFEDYLRQNNLEIYPKADPRVSRFRETAFRLSDLRNLSSLGNFIERPELPDNPQDAANFLLTLCHQTTYLLHRQIESTKERFVKVGGLNEQLAAERRKHRGY